MTSGPSNKKSSSWKTTGDDHHHHHHYYYYYYYYCNMCIPSHRWLFLQVILLPPPLLLPRFIASTAPLQSPTTTPLPTTTTTTTTTPLPTTSTTTTTRYRDREGFEEVMTQASGRLVDLLPLLLPLLPPDKKEVMMEMASLLHTPGLWPEKWRVVLEGSGSTREHEEGEEEDSSSSSSKGKTPTPCSPPLIDFDSHPNPKRASLDSNSNLNWGLPSSQSSVTSSSNDPYGYDGLLLGVMEGGDEEVVPNMQLR